jgi:DNA-binding MarR family transcriptional regulator
MQNRPEIIQTIRAFNRYYTTVIGLLDGHFLDTPYSLTEARVLYEISHIGQCTAKKIRANIYIDEGYLSRIIDKFGRLGLIRKTPAPEDRRLHLIVLTEKGKREFSKLDDNSNKAIGRLIQNISVGERGELVGNMERIRQLLSKSG